MIDYKFKNDRVTFNSPDFRVRDIFECGQAFRWYPEEDESYTVVAGKGVLNVSEYKGQVLLIGTSEEDFRDYWHNYFDLDRDYGQIKEALRVNPTLEEALEYGRGIRILNQDVFETVISFIISANNRIPMIMRSVELIAQTYGKKIGEDHKRSYYSFPQAQVLAQADPAELREICRVGFRDQRIVDTAMLFAGGEFDKKELEKMETGDLLKKLQELPGVGPKVANCILLFAFCRREVFPVDVWIKRVMEHLFIGKEASPKEIMDLAQEIFGHLGGYAQQYLFYYGRDNDIGRDKK